MNGSEHIIIALISGLAAGLLVMLVGRRMLAGWNVAPPEPVLTQEPLLQPRPSAPDNLSPEAQAFVDALKSNAVLPQKPAEDTVWRLDVWDTRHTPSGAQGMPH